MGIDRIEQTGYALPGKGAPANCFNTMKRNFAKILDGDYSFSSDASSFDIATDDYNAQNVRRIMLNNSFAGDSTSISRPFEWTDLDTDRNATCGNRKCFFHRSSTVQTSTSEGEPSKEGYLVANECATYKKDEKEYQENYFEWVQYVYNVARRLEREDNIRHFLLEPPQRVALPPLDVVRRLNSIALRNGELDLTFFGNDTKHNTCHSNSVVVQKVRVAPYPNLVPRCYFTAKSGSGGRFYWHNKASVKEFGLAAVEKHQFLRTFEMELESLIDLLKKEERLWYSFQFLVDYKGRIHHIDIDRIEQSGHPVPKPSASGKCLDSIKRNFVKILNGKY